MAFTILIDGVDKSDFIDWKSVKLDQVITDQVDSLSFSTKKYGTKLFTPQALSTIEFYEDANLIFSGGIVTVKEDVTVIDYIVYNVVCKDQSLYMDRRLIIETFENVPVINIVCTVLNRYINRGSMIEVASFENSETWSGGTIDTDHFRINTQSRKLTSINESLEILTRNIYLNLQPEGYDTDDYIDIDMFVDVAANVQSVVMTLGSEDLLDYFSLDITDQITVDGWNLCHVPLSDFTDTGTPDWSNIRRIQLELVSMAGETVEVSFDNWQVIKKDAFTRFNSQGATQIVKYIAMLYEYPTKAFERLAELFAWNWYVDENKDIHFFAKFDKSAPFSLSDNSGNYIYNSLAINRNADQLRNSIYVRGSDYLGNTRTEDLSHQADGVNKIFKLGYRYKNATLELNGDQLSLGVDNIDDFDDNLGVRQASKGGGLISVGNVAGNTYQSLQVITGKHGRRSGTGIRIKKVGAPLDNFVLQIFADDGNNAPSGTALSTTSIKSGPSLTTNLEDVSFPLTETSLNSLLFEPDEKYHIVTTRSGGLDAVNYYQIDIVDNVKYEGYAYSGAAGPVWTQQQWTWYFFESLSYDALHSFNEKVVDFSIAPLSTDVIEFTADPFLPVFVLYKENESIMEVGEFQYKIQDKSIKSKEGAQQRALEEILGWAEATEDVTFRTYQSGLRAGQTINIQSDIRGLDENYVIKKISMNLRSPLGLPQYSVSCISTRTYGIIYWMQKQIMKDDRDIEIDENEIQDKIEAIFENLIFNTEYTTTLYQGKVWSNDLGTTPDKGIWQPDIGYDPAYIWI